MNDVAMHYLRIEELFRKVLNLDFKTATELSSRPEFKILETIQNVPSTKATTEENSVSENSSDSSGSEKQFLPACKPEKLVTPTVSTSLVDTPVTEESKM